MDKHAVWLISVDTEPHWNIVTDRHAVGLTSVDTEPNIVMMDVCTCSMNECLIEEPLMIPSTFWIAHTLDSSKMDARYLSTYTVYSIVADWLCVKKIYIECWYAGSLQTIENILIRTSLSTLRKETTKFHRCIVKNHRSYLIKNVILCKYPSIIHLLHILCREKATEISSM